MRTNAGGTRQLSDVERVGTCRQMLETAIMVAMSCSAVQATTAHHVVGSARPTVLRWIATTSPCVCRGGWLGVVAAKLEAFRPRR